MLWYVLAVITLFTFTDLDMSRLRIIQVFLIYRMRGIIMREMLCICGYELSGDRKTSFN